MKILNFSGFGGGGGSATPAGSAGEIQYNDGGTPAQLAASADLTWDDTGKVLEIGGDIDLNDGGTYTTTLQTITPTANRTVSIPDATGTVALVAGSSGQPIYNNAGAYAGLSTATIGTTGNITLSLNGAASTPPVSFTGTWFTGGTGTTTKPQLLIEPTGTTSTAWSTSGTGFGVNAASGFSGNLLDLQVNGTSQFRANNSGTIFLGNIDIAGGGNNQNLQFGTALRFKFSSLAVLNGATAEYSYASLNLLNGVGLSWTSGTSLTSVPDLVLFRDAADTLAQRRTTNAQTFRCYGTYTDASNYVRAALSSTSTAVTLAAETAGTGADDIPLNLTAAGTGTVKVNSVVEVVVSSTVAGLPAAPAVGMLTRVTDATAPAVGSTVAGGGAAAALVWYNGTNWTVIGV